MIQFRKPCPTGPRNQLTRAPVRYDPYAHEVMLDPHSTYARLRAESPVPYIEAYECWALSRFEDIWQASLDTKVFSVAEGTSPGQILLGEPTFPSFMTMDLPEQRVHRSLIGDRYTRAAVARLESRIRAITRELLAPLLEARSFDLYRDLANRVSIRRAALLAGVPLEDAEMLRGWIDGFFRRQPGQVGNSADNLAYAERISAYLGELVAERRRSPARGEDHLSAWLRADESGLDYGDEAIVSNLYSIMVTGSETVPLAIGSAIAHLETTPGQKRRVLADPELALALFAETLRFEQPTNLLGRRLREDVEIRGCKLRAGQGVLLLFASGNRDEAEFPRADVFDIDRRSPRSLNYGHGIHICIGLHLGNLEGRVVLEEFFSSIRDFQVDLPRCERLYGEFLNGYASVPVHVDPR